MLMNLSWKIFKLIIINTKISLLIDDLFLIYAGFMSKPVRKGSEVD